MPESRTVIECPLCRCRMEVPRHEGTRVYTCRNGHRFLRKAPASSGAALERVPLLMTIVLLALLAFFVVYAVAGHHWWRTAPLVGHG